MADDDHRAIRQVLAQFVEAWNAHNADAFANLYTDPHVDVNHSPSVEMRAATVAALRKRFEHSAPRLSVSSEEIIAFGDWAVERGAIAISSDGQTQHLRYIEVLQRDDDGQWRLHWGIDAPVKSDA